MTTDRIVKAVWAEARTPNGQNIIMGDSATNSLPWPPDPIDLRHFREETRDHVLVMGANTFDSLPDRLKTEASTKERPLIVLTRNGQRANQIIDATPSASVQPAVSWGAPDPVRGPMDMKWPGRPVAVIGGPSIIALFEPVLTHLVITHIRGRYDGDVFAPADSLFDSFYTTHQTTGALRVSRHSRKGNH